MVHFPCFWRNSLSPVEQKLLVAVLLAHAKSAYRENPSTQVVLATAKSSGDYLKAVAAGILTLGGQHAPIEESYDLLNADSPRTQAAALLAQGNRVPGFGSSFHKEGVDPLWLDVEKALAEANPKLSAEIAAITEGLTVKRLWPNPSSFTAAAAITLGLPKKTAQALVLMGRLESWSQLAGGVL